MAAAFHCPTTILSGNVAVTAKQAIAGRPWLLVTSTGWVRRGLVARLEAALGAPHSLIDAVPTNPRLSDIAALAIEPPPGAVVVAAGGGSVMDAAKGIVALSATTQGMGGLSSHLQAGAALGLDATRVAPLVAIPTTSGTGSEVTQWATIWGEHGEKFSLAHPSLRPTHALLDPALCVSMTPEVTLYSALDALSHAMESVWNVNHGPVTDALATQAIRLIRTNLQLAFAAPADLGVRGHLQTASLLAGLAMGATQTALAHSISYPLTARFGVPHGFACGFTLAQVARYNLPADPARLAPIADGLGVATDQIATELERWFGALGLAQYLRQWLKVADIDGLEGQLIAPSRAANNIRPADETAAREIAKEALRQSGVE